MLALIVLSFAVASKFIGHNKKVDVRYKTFSIYLNENFHFEIPLKQHYFCIVEISTCEACVNSALKSIKELSFDSNSTIIVSKDNNNLFDDEINSIPYGKIIIDSIGNLKSLDLGKGIRIIQTNESNIDSIYSFNARNMNEFDLFLKKLAMQKLSKF